VYDGNGEPSPGHAPQVAQEAHKAPEAQAQKAPPTFQVIRGLTAMLYLVPSCVVFLVSASCRVRQTRKLWRIVSSTTSRFFFAVAPNTSPDRPDRPLRPSPSAAPLSFSAGSRVSVQQAQQQNQCQPWCRGQGGETIPTWSTPWSPVQHKAQNYSESCRSDVQ
jgi:hypothetical protein